MVEYVAAHWRGELSLARSYWVNYFLLGVAGSVGVVLVEGPMSALPLPSLFAIFACMCVVAVWSIVGLWRSASNASRRTGRIFWPAVAKLLVCIGLLKTAADVGSVATDLVRTYDALHDPSLTEYAIERRGDTDLILTGAINGRSTAEVIHALQDPSIEILRVNSHGGLIDPAIRLARYIHENEVMVMAEGECISACVMLLAASPYAAIYPGTKITFHRAEPVVELTSPEMIREQAMYLAEATAIYLEFGVASWALETAGRQQFWTPTIEQQIQMGLIVMIFDPDGKNFLAADEYCSKNPPKCYDY